MIVSKLAEALKRGTRRSIVKNEDGVTAIEFGMIAPIFFWMMGSLMETGIMMFTEYVMQTSVQEAARLVRTGQAQADGLDVDAFKAKICETATVIASCSSSVNVNMVAANSFADLDVPSYLSVGTNYGGGGAENMGFACGQPGQAVALIATYDWEFTVPWLGKYFANIDSGKKRRLAGIYMFQNEPFPSGGNCA